MVAKRKKMSWLSITGVVLVCIGVAYGAYWFADQQGWLLGAPPSRPPTAEERERMEEIERTSSEIAPNAVPGAGVRPRGSLPPKEPQGTTSTSTATSTATNTVGTSTVDAEEL